MERQPCSHEATRQLQPEVLYVFDIDFQQFIIINLELMDKA